MTPRPGPICEESIRWLLDRLPDGARGTARVSKAGTVAWRSDGRYLRFAFESSHRIHVTRDDRSGRRQCHLLLSMNIAELIDLVRWATSGDSSPS